VIGSRAVNAAHEVSDIAAHRSHTRRTPFSGGAARCRRRAVVAAALVFGLAAAALGLVIGSFC